MGIGNRLVSRFPSSLSFILLTILLGILWLAGGASRADALGQVLVRGSAWALLIAALLFGGALPFRKVRPLLLLLAATVLLALIQLIPLPPDFWQALPGHAPLAGAAEASSQAQSWRPWSIVPAATVNALSSLIVPVVVLMLAAGMKEGEHEWLLRLILGLIVTSMLLGLLQVSGVTLDNPLINDTMSEVSGSFANRNHFALFLAFGCLIAPVWAFGDEHGRGRGREVRGVAALGMIVLFALTILASGSRAGMLVGVIGIGLGLTLAWRGIARALRRYPRWVSPALIAGVVGLVGVFVFVSAAMDRAASIDRAFAVDVGQDMRTRSLPTVLAAIGTYFPAGSGLGGFDPIFRIHEPFDLLNRKYVNHAHNEFLEIALDAGVLGLVLLLASLSWWVQASVRAWRSGPDERNVMPKLGSAMILLVIVASAFDYPARTPMMMAMIVVAGIWLNGVASVRKGTALPRAG